MCAMLKHSFLDHPDSAHISLLAVVTFPVCHKHKWMRREEQQLKGDQCRVSEELKHFKRFTLE